MSDDFNLYVSIQETDFDFAKEQTLALQDADNVGAVVAFTGLCRDEDGKLSALELEHYPDMAEKQITTIALEAAQRWPLKSMRIIHRFGKITPNENIVLVVATSRHREAAFNGANYIMDFLKTNAPFWKKEHLIDGNEGDWVEAHDKDNDALKKWD